jgi:UDP-N-acetylglucosamine 2-epimerase (non-hydrolysing)
VLVTRFATERPEALEAGVARLVGTLRTAILEGAAAILSAPAKRRSARRPVNPYGDGRAAQRIADALAESFSEEPGGHDRDRRGEHQHDAEQE